MPIKYVEGVDNHNVNVGAIRVFMNRVDEEEDGAERTAKNKLCQACNQKLSTLRKRLPIRPTPAQIQPHYERAARRSM